MKIFKFFILSCLFMIFAAGTALAAKAKTKKTSKKTSKEAVSQSTAPAQAAAEPIDISTFTLPWKVGEKLTFNIGVGVLGAGQAVMEIKDIVEVKPSTHPESVSIKTFHFVATAQSNSFVDVFYKVRDKNEAWLDPVRMVSHRFEQHNQEGKYILDQVVEFDWFYKRFKNVENVQGRNPKYEEGDLTVPAVDTLSSLYLARTKNFNVGEEFTLDVHSGKNWPLVVKVLRKEKVKVPAGEFECFVVEPFLRDRGLFIQKGKKMQVWLTADERKIPVMMKAEIFIGSVAAELVAMQ